MKTGRRADVSRFLRLRKKGKDMKCKKEDMQLYAVTDRTWVGEKSFEEQVEESLEKSGS